MSLPDAVLARMRTVVDPVYDGHVPVDAQGRPLVQRYAVLYASPGLRSADDLGRTADRHTFPWQVTSVGQSREQVEWVAIRCRDALLDEPLVEAGWQIGIVEHLTSSQIRRDDDIPGDSVFYGVDTYELTATR